MDAANIAPNDLSKLIKARINALAPTISGGPLGLAYQKPEHWAEPSRCFQNVSRKVSQDGGCTRFGWTFHHRLVSDIPGPGYLFLTHHAVWNAPDGRLVDVSPYPDPKHQPISPGGSTLFLMDINAEPVRIEKLVAPLSLQFFALSDDEPLVAYVKQLNQKEQEKCAMIYAGSSDDAAPPTGCSR